MTLDALYIGQDKVVQFELSDDEGAIVFDDLQDMVVLLSINNEEVAKFSKEQREGFGEIFPVDGHEDACEIRLTSEQTKLFNTGKMRAEVALVFEDEAFVDGKFDFNLIDLFSVKKSLLAEM